MEALYWAAIFTFSSFCGAVLAVGIGLWIIKRMDKVLLDSLGAAMHENTTSSMSGQIAVVVPPPDPSGLPRLN